MRPASSSPGRSRRHHGDADDHPSIDRAQLACAAYGLVLLVAPGPILRTLPGRHRGADRRALLATRALGARHLIQATALIQRPSRRWMLAGACIDATHAGTMLALAVARPNRRALATISATFAVLIAVAEIQGSWRSQNRLWVQSGTPLSKTP